MAEYFVYRSVGRRATYPDNWALVSKHADLAEAEKAAESLCPKGCEIYTEGRQLHGQPERDLKRAWFGSANSDKWSSMIDTVDIHLRAKR